MALAFPESSACASHRKKLENIARTSAVQTATAMMLPGTPFLWSSESSRIEPERDPKTAFSGTSSRSEKTSVRMWMLFRLKLLVDCPGLVGVGTQMSRVLEFDCGESKFKSPGGWKEGTPLRGHWLARLMPQLVCRERGGCLGYTVT